MARLPYTATLMATTEDIVNVQHWCLEMWPYTQGATWYKGWEIRSVTVSAGYSCTWSFQFQADLLMFLLTWSHMVVQS